MYELELFRTLLLQAAPPIPPELIEKLGPWGPYAAALVTLITGIMGYGALKERVAQQGKDREEDVKNTTTADAARRQEIKELSEAFVARIDELRAELEKSNEAHRGAYNGLGRRIDDRILVLNREIGEVRGQVANTNVRINAHGIASDEQQTRNAEFYAKEAKDAEARVNAKIAELERKGT